jgi:hypothetical protein
LPPRPARPRAAIGWFSLSAGLLLWLLLVSAPTHAETVELARLEALRSDQGVLLSFESRFQLPPAVEDALQKGVALHFVAEAELMRARWYWRDQQVSSVSRNWRLTYQPLTFSYRVNQGGLSQSYRSLGEALRSVQRASDWRIADPVPDEEGRYYVAFSYKLDANQLPRPLQIGLSGQPDWSLQITRTIPVTSESH